MRKPKILISACLCGIPCRYDGRNSAFDSDTWHLLEDSFEPVATCPELIGGLPCPRKPCELETKSKSVKSSDGQDLTKNFKLGAQLSLNICKNYGIEIAVLKSKSPSCGKGKIYDGSFSRNLVEGNGVTCDLLISNGIKVMDENQLKVFIHGREGN